jgi:hypothetical protein
VIAQPVGLHDQSDLGPEEVDFKAVDPLFAQGRRETCRSRERAEVDLQIRVGEAKGELVEQLRKGPTPGSPA